MCISSRQFLMKINLNRSVVSIPDCFSISLTDLPSWIRYFTMSNNHNNNEIQSYIVIIPDAFSNEIIGEYRLDSMDLYPLAIRFSGRRIYDHLKSDQHFHYGFALYAVYEKTTNTGFRIITITQEIKDKSNIKIDSFAVQGKIENVLRKIKTTETDIVQLTRYVFRVSDIFTIEETYKYVARFFLNFKKARLYFYVINNRPSSRINKKATIDFLDISIEFTFDLERKKETQSYITRIEIVSKNECNKHPLLSVEDVIEIFDEKSFITYMRDFLLPKK